MKKLTRFFLIVFTLVICLLLVSCKGGADTTVSSSTEETSSEGADTTEGVTAESTADETTATVVERVSPEEITVGKVRIQLLSDTLVRHEVAMTNGSFQDAASYSVINRDKWYKVDYTVEEDGSNTVIKTENYIITLPTSATNISKAVITSPDGEELWHYETKTDSDIFLPSPSDELDAWYFTDNPRVIPSEYGYSLPSDGTTLTNNGWKTDKNATDCFVFLPQGSYKQFMLDFIDLTGRSEMITLNLLGYWDSRYYEYSETTALKQIKDYQNKGYSIDVLVIDTDWRDASRGVGYEINDSLFPDMARFLEKAHALGVTIVFNDHPEPVSGTDNLLDAEEIEYRTENLTLLLSLGLDYWWYDRNWTVALNGIDSGLSLFTTGMYAFQWITESYYESIVEDADEYARRALIMANVDGIWNGEMTDPTEVAAHRYTLQWTGDIGTSSESLKKEFYNAIYGGAEMGIPYISADLGGHTSEVSSEMYVRWIQFGALSNICRVHCTKPFSRMPWLYGDVAVSVAKEYVGMRYRLLPVYYTLAYENYTTGLPIMRRLDIAYPQYAEANANDEYMLGDYIIVAPISGKTLTPVEGSWLTSNGRNGLYVEYFRNNALSGTPAYTGYTTTLSYDWVESGPSELGGLSDNFSVRWSGEITVGENDTYLCFFADDGVKCWIDGELVVDGWSVYDTYLETPFLEAGKTYDIKIEYCEYGGKAHIQVGAMNYVDDAREVFLPEGVWMDVWTGEEYVGPTTVTVMHGLETSPIFVRQGAIIPLVSQAQNTSEIDWSKITLDVYPSTNYDAKATIYEDDYSTVAYKDGQYRTTEVTTDYADSVLTIRIGATRGSYDGAPDFTEREYTVHLHDRANFGSITKIEVNGVVITLDTYKKSSDSTPFIETGAALDADITEFTVKTALDKAVEIKVYYESATDDGVNEDYDDSAVDFTVKATTITKNGMQNLNLSEEGDLDWAMFGASTPDSIIRKKNGKGWISATESWDSIYEFSDNYTICWTDGDTTTSGSSTRGPVSGRNFDVELTTDGSKVTYTIYLGGYKSVAKITVRDRAGNVETLTFGNLATNFYRKITIECEAGEASTLYVNYSLLCGDNITFSAVTVSAD